MSEQASHRPLVAFTSLGIAGAGLVAASACLEALYSLESPRFVTAGAFLLAAGLAASLFHLGQKRKAGLAMRRAGRSALSNEVALAGLALASAALAAGLDMAGAHARGASIVAGTAGAVFLASVGFVYRVRGQRTWQGFSVFTPLTGGLAFGAVALQSLAGSGAVYRGTLLLVAIDGLVFLQRWREIAGLLLPDAMVGERRLARRDQLLGARFFLLDVVPAMLMVAWPTPLAVAVAAAGLVVDRMAFYALAIHHTTEHEVAAVEDVIARLDRPARS